MILKAVCNKFTSTICIEKYLTIFNDIITSRKTSILKNLEDAETRFQQAAENLSFAKDQLQKAKIKSEQIRNQGITMAKQTASKIISSVESDIKRLKETTLYTIKVEEEKCLTEVVRL